MKGDHRRNEARGLPFLPYYDCHSRAPYSVYVFRCMLVHHIFRQLLWLFIVLSLTKKLMKLGSRFNRSI